MSSTSKKKSTDLKELAIVFFRLGAIAFGGPAAPEGGTWTQGPDAGPWSESGWREGGNWERDASGDDQMRRLENGTSIPRVRDSFDRIQLDNNRVSPRIITPVDPSTPVEPPVRPGRINTMPRNTTTPNNFGR